MRIFKKIGLVLLVILSITFLFSGCGNLSEGYYDDFASTEFVQVGSERKVVYSANLSLYAENVSTAVTAIKSAMPEDSWVQEENSYVDNTFLVLRVKTSGLDAFVSALNDIGTIEDLSKTAIDVTDDTGQLNYRKKALEAEHARLLELIATADFNEISTNLNPRLAEIETELNQINENLTVYDYRVDFSQVVIDVYKAETPQTFWQKLGTAFTVGWNFVKVAFIFICSMLVFFVPIILIAAPIVGIVFLIIYLVKRKKKSKIPTENQAEEPPKELENK